MFLDGDDDLPEPCAPDNALSQESRLLRLEEELAWLKRHHFGAQGSRRRSPSPPPPQQPHQQHLDQERNSVPAREYEDELERSAMCDSTVNAVPNRWDEEREDKAHYELRRLVSHLSPEFSCSERDAVLLVSAIRGGSIAGGVESREDRLALLESERRAAQNKLERKSQECEDLKDSVADLRQRLRTTQQEAHASATLLSQRREEVRKQLLLEESRTQKLQVRNGKLEMEVERLKDMLHSRMR
ncbi:hypothetical protein DQ04_01901050 [Trypanosoma grayi]|uniref:hypothetical protein n=1 Tax=Trypanosoma grayi TaxID=71804 RepID=UPI0004F461DD|nr:hypothetical protein DQ04_01901050 [Trypanosoma grayi]KEG12199.1 hypothetical protein DQ04_01901050 [Trypanosoma grayi]